LIECASKAYLLAVHWGSITSEGTEPVVRLA
jgi:hypothetical protein